MLKLLLEYKRSIFNASNTDELNGFRIYESLFQKLRSADEYNNKPAKKKQAFRTFVASSTILCTDTSGSRHNKV
jgi:hypothetical protein